MTSGSLSPMTHQPLPTSALQPGAVFKPVEYKLEPAGAKRSVAFQGNIGSFSHCAARHFAEKTFGQYETSLVACKSFSEVFEKIESSKEFYGAIPLENTSMGSIDANYDLLWTRSAIIVHEVFVPVQHNLITIANTALEDIRQVYSHPAALEQCRKIFQKYIN